MRNAWIAAAALAVGLGISAQAQVTNAGFGAWSFEDVALGTSLLGAGDPAQPMAAGYGSWSADTNNGVAYITNSTIPAGLGKPIATTHDRALYFDGSVTNHIASNTVGIVDSAFYTDFLLLPGQLEDSSLLAQVDDSARLAFFFDTNGYFNLLHGDLGAWKTSVFSTVTYDSNSWVRITIEQDYTFDGSKGGLYSMFQVWVNGANLTHANGYTRTGANTYTADGKWFEMKESGPNVFGMNALVGMGIGTLDDVVIRTDTPFGAVTDIEVMVSANLAYGTITPSGTQVIVDGTPLQFNLEVNPGLDVYVSGLTLDGTQIYTNETTTVTQQFYTVSYAQANTIGTNVVALFEAVPGTTADWITDSFTIGAGGDYATFAAALAGDWDLDGFTNEEEGIAGTDPKNIADYLKITGIAIDALGNVVVSFTGSAAGAQVPYEIHGATTVDGTYTYTTNTTKAAGAKNVEIDPGVGTKSFYKIVIPYP